MDSQTSEHERTSSSSSQSHFRNIGPLPFHPRIVWIRDGIAAGTPTSGHSSVSTGANDPGVSREASPHPSEPSDTRTSPPMSVADQDEQDKPTARPGSNGHGPVYTWPEWAQTDDEYGSQPKNSEESTSHGFLTISDLTTEDVSIVTTNTHPMRSATSDDHAINNDILSDSSTKPRAHGKKTRRFEDIPEQTPPPLKGPVILATFGSFGEVLWSAEDVISGYPGTGPMSPGQRYLECESGDRDERCRGVINCHGHLSRLQNEMREMRKRKVLANSSTARELIQMERRVAELKEENENLKGRIFELGQRIQ